MRSLAASITALLLFCHAQSVWATTYNITTAANFSSLPATLAAGDEIVIQNGTYANVGRTLTAAGTATNPVRMYAVNPGSVFFTGGTQFVLKGTNMVVSGLIFTNGCPKFSSGVFRFEANSSDFILRDCKFYEFDSCSPASGAYWIQINGYRHTVEYCSFIGKSAEDQLITIIPTEDEDVSGFPTKNVPRRHLIRHCYFADRTNISTNGFETIQIGESQYQMYDMSTTVEYCLFKRAIYGDDVSIYEPEVITSKSKNNIFRYNTFVENKGGLVLRHGDDCVVDGNFFFGESGSTMGAGVRIIGLRHIIRNNYLENIDGTDLRAAICLMKGSGEFPEDSTSNGYESPGTARIFHNTIVNCNQPFALGATTSSSGTTPPNNVEIRNNVVQSAASDGPVVNFNSANGWTISQIAFSGNQAYHPSGTYGTVPASGFATGTPVNLTLDVPLGYLIPQAGSPVINSAAATTPATVYDIRSKLRPGPPHDAGSYDSEGSGASFNRPLAKSDVGPVFDGRTNPNRVPTLLSQPVSQSVFEGNPVSFSVTATNETDPIFSYQWRLNEVAIVGATGSTFMVNSAALADAGSYSVAVTNAGGRTISYPAVLSVAPAAPVITTQPAPKLVSVGGSATFTVAADGIAPFSYQWRKDTVPITWGTNSSLTVTNVQGADVGNYSVVVSNAYGTATSQDAALSLVGGTILLSDSFDDGIATNQSLPASAKWFTSSGSLTIQSGALSMIAGRHALAFFKNSGVQSLGVGEQITASFTLKFSTVGNSSGGFRFGFFNSNGASRPPDPNNAAFTNYDGYIVTTTATYPDSNANSSGPIVFRQRNTGVAGTLISTTGSGIYSDVASSPSTSQGFVAGTNYVVTFTISRTTTGTVNLAVGVTGGVLSNYTFAADDVSGIVTGFDGFAVLSTQANGSTYSIDNVTVVYAAIPATPSASFSASPTGGPAPLTVTFTDNSTGTITSVDWDFGDGGTTNFTAPTNVQHLYATAGVYTVTLVNSNPSGAATNTQSNLITATALDPYTSWASNYFGCTICPEAQADADPLGKGISNTNQFLLGLNPTDPASVFRILSAVTLTTDVVITWAAGGGRTNAVQATSGDVNGAYTTNFVDITTAPHLFISGNGNMTNNYTDIGGATNVPARFYRVRFVP
jgi:poly(beta-D-mannuronate) lyase